MSITYRHCFALIALVTSSAAPARNLPSVRPNPNQLRAGVVHDGVLSVALEAKKSAWHGVEIEDSYMDGVPGFSGAGRHLAPAIAPGDSFEARYTPQRRGTLRLEVRARHLLVRVPIRVE